MNKYLILIYLFPLVSSLAYSQPELYEKKPDIKTQSVKAGSKTFFTFGFKDLDGKYQEWDWSDENRKLNDTSNKFGLYGKDPKNFSYYDGELEKGFFKEHFQIGVIPDYSRLAKYYQSLTYPLYQRWKALTQEKSLNQRESIELILRFFQDYPYGVSPDVKDNRFIAGLYVAPLIFTEGYADCDSKSLLMASVLSHDSYFKNKMAMILVPGHAFLGINMRPSVYDEYYTLRNVKYVVAEPTGLSRTPLGRKNSPYKRILAIDPISIEADGTSSSSSSITQVSNESYQPMNQLKVLTKEDCPDNGLLIDYESVSLGVRIQMCQIKSNGEYLKHGPEIIFSKSGQPEILKNYNNGIEL